MNWVKPFVFQLLFTAALAQTAVMRAGAQTQPSISLQPDMIPAGGQTTVSGAGFCGEQACSSVTITLDGAELLTDVAVAADGAFSIGITPLTTPGRRIVAATQDTPGGRISADALLTVTVSDQATTPPAAEPTGTAAPSPTPTTELTATPTPPPSASETVPASPSATPADLPSRQTSDGGLPWWAWTLIAAVAVAVAGGGGWLAWRAGR